MSILDSSTQCDCYKTVVRWAFISLNTSFFIIFISITNSLIYLDKKETASKLPIRRGSPYRAALARKISYCV